MAALPDAEQPKKNLIADDVIPLFRFGMCNLPSRDWQGAFGRLLL